ncbi:MAG: hypothetical protein M3Y82_01600 [Verrucomicrobiota bacterium]|nr:hypothetical protein [Verrucomicrobiota bacterium]
MRSSQAALAGLLVAWLLFSSLLAANPTLHQWLHNEAAQSSHQCAITFFEQQQILFYPAPSFLFVGNFNLIYFAPPHESSLASATDLQLLPSRAPPSPFSV